MYNPIYTQTWKTEFRTRHTYKNAKKHIFGFRSAHKHGGSWFRHSTCAHNDISYQSLRRFYESPLMVFRSPSFTSHVLHWSLWSQGQKVLGQGQTEWVPFCGLLELRPERFGNRNPRPYFVDFCSQGHWRLFGVLLQMMLVSFLIVICWLQSCNLSFPQIPNYLNVGTRISHLSVFSISRVSKI